MTELLRIDGLRTRFETHGRVVRAVDGVSLTVGRGETVGVVGESGSGKSMTALSTLRLVPRPGRIVGGSVLFGEPGRQRDLLTMSDEEIRAVRGRDIAMVFQDPMTSLNPVHTVGRQIEEAIEAHARVPRRELHERVVSLLARVRIPSPEQRSRDYPHRFSGGMRQRAMIAMALANEPSLLIADEPTTALDVTVQSGIIELLRELNRDTGMAIVLITHNISLVVSLCTRVVVMYAGRVVEEGPTRQVLGDPQHPYTWSLLRSIPRVDEPRDRLVSITGQPPDLTDPPHGCTFHPRCPFRVDRCTEDEPELDLVGDDRRARCWVLMRNTRAEVDAS
ncbi:MAG TPA: ABC transporter ATP-binding protein [Streptosporangiales bacterium]